MPQACTGKSGKLLLHASLGFHLLCATVILHSSTPSHLSLHYTVRKKNCKSAFLSQLRGPFSDEYIKLS